MATPYTEQSVTRLGLHLVRKRAQQTLRWSAPGIHRPRVLEIGPGRGILAQEAVKADVEYWAVDVDPATQFHLPPETRFHCCRVPPIRLADGLMGPCFDAIIAEAVLEHMPGYSQARELLQECRRWLYPHGRLVLRFPEIRFSHWGFWEFPADHQYVTSLPRVLAVLRETGFTVLRCGYFLDHLTGWLVHPVWWATRLTPARLLNRLTGRPPYELTTWHKLRKPPQAYILAQKSPAPQSSASEPPPGSQ